ncbi:hypothetical protein F7725_024572 [Dissostichus mawsoni]|uniref:Uncharacterized protein n=1 Tax=Dissostichus mawsoni TaxID=36200 RepID=A0A7J5Y0L5_DISMA|nr:hypothetical protein F7725_024572 [Dissostichus mawsoni]
MKRQITKTDRQSDSQTDRQTDSQARRSDPEVSLTDTMLGTMFSDEEVLEEKPEIVVSLPPEVAAVTAQPAGAAIPSDGPTLPVTRERLLAAQRADPTLVKCFEQVVSNDKARVCPETGRVNGVAKQLQDTFPWMVSVACAAHRLALCCKDASSEWLT